jgi:hypothetical protein
VAGGEAERQEWVGAFSIRSGGEAEHQAKRQEWGVCVESRMPGMFGLFVSFG